MAAVHAAPGHAADLEKLAAHQSAAPPSVEVAAAAPHEDCREDVRTSEDDGAPYPKGFVLISLTLGMMGAVLMVALDNYILGNGFASTVTLCSDFPSNRHPENHHSVQQLGRRCLVCKLILPHANGAPTNVWAAVF